MMATPTEALARWQEMQDAAARHEKEIERELASCPHCEGTAYFERVAATGKCAGTVIAAVCCNCGASGPGCEEPEDAAHRWNKRAETPLAVTLKTLRQYRDKARADGERALAQIFSDTIARITP